MYKIILRSENPHVTMFSGQKILQVVFFLLRILIYTYAISSF